jgi:hypothetical protein
MLDVSIPNFSTLLLFKNAVKSTYAGCAFATIEQARRALLTGASDGALAEHCLAAIIDKNGEGARAFPIVHEAATPARADEINELRQSAA